MRKHNLKYYSAPRDSDQDHDMSFRSEASYGLHIFWFHCTWPSVPALDLSTIEEAKSEVLLRFTVSEWHIMISIGISRCWVILQIVLPHCASSFCFLILLPHSSSFFLIPHSASSFFLITSFLILPQYRQKKQNLKYYSVSLYLAFRSCSCYTTTSRIR